jgi:hypothetical protein
LVFLCATITIVAPLPFGQMAPSLRILPRIAKRAFAGAGKKLAMLNALFVDDAVADVDNDGAGLISVARIIGAIKSIIADVRHALTKTIIAHVRMGTPLLVIALGPSQRQMGTSTFNTCICGTFVII